MLRRTSVDREWDARVQTWEQVAASPAFRELTNEVCTLAAPEHDDRVVDLGAGTGLLALALAPQVATVVAVDASRCMLERLAENARGANLRNVDTACADLRTLPLEDESVTLAVSNYAFHHLDDAGKELALSEVRRVLVPGGRLVLCDMMFSLSLQPRDRRLIAGKVVAVARRGPAGLLRIARNACRVAAGTWEKPAPPETWQRMLEQRRFESVSIRVLEHEGGIAVARKPAPRPAERTQVAGIQRRARS